jgi:hypothetical protein
MLGGAVAGGALIGSRRCPLVLALPKTCPSEATDQVSAVYCGGADADGVIAQFGRHVVVVALKSPTRNAEALCEAVELLVRLVAYQMGPPPASPGPHRRIDEDGHGLQARWQRTASTMLCV